MNRDPLKPNRNQFTNGPAGHVKYLSAFVVYQASQITLLDRRVKELEAQIDSINRVAEGGRLVAKHERRLARN